MSQKIFSLVSLVACALCAFVLIVPSALGGQEAVLPSMVIEDSNGDPVGPVVGYNNLNEPIIRVMDPGLNIPILVSVESPNHISGPMNSTYFSSTNCSGTAYHNANFSFATDGLAEFTGYGYSIARTGGDQWVFRSPVSGTGGSVQYNSIFTSHDDTCTNETNTIGTLREADLALNLDNQSPPPYNLQ